MSDRLLLVICAGWVACIVWVLWMWHRTTERAQIATRKAAEEQWRRELIAFLAKHPVAGDDSDMVA